MSEETGKDSNVKSTIEAVTGLVKAVPIYDDALQPAAKQIGKSLETVTKSVNIALAPIRALVWGFEKIETWLTLRLAEKLKNVPEDQIMTPPPNLAGPAIEALRYAGFEERLRELYSNLLAAAMDKATAAQAHPGYVEVLKNLSGDEALLLQLYIGRSALPAIQVKSVSESGASITHHRFYTHVNRSLALTSPELVPSYLDNFIRLGLTEVPVGAELADPVDYILLETDPALEPLFNKITDQNEQIYFERIIIRLTNFGAQFVQQVVRSKTT